MDFDKVYQDHHKHVLGFLIKKLNDIAIAEELANDVFMRVHKHQDNYDPNIASIKTWVFNISNRILIDYFRKKKLATVSLSLNDDGEEDIYRVNLLLGEIDANNDRSNNPHLELVSKETMKQAQNAIVALPKKYKRICNLFFNHNYKMVDIAVMTNKPLNTVKGDIHKARKVLQKELVNI